jgi:meiosis induction protein kinase IME2/SME1
VLIPVHTPDAQVRAAMVRDDSGPHGASALVHQLRALDLPTDDLASYGFREPSEEPMYDRPPNVSPHVAAYVQQQQQHYMQQQAMRQVTQSMPSLPTHHENRSDPSSHSTINVSQVPSQQSLHSPPPEMSSSAGTALGSLNKKKKWLGAVFGNNNSEKHPELAAVDEQPGYSGLKRTQSGHYADERILDPKVAKKLAEREQLELLKAKRDADARAQAERSRAVMQKRQQFLDYSGDSVEHINLTWGSKKVPISSMHPHAGHGGHSGQVAHGGPSGHGGHREREHSAHREHSHLRQHGSHPYSHGHEGRNKSRKTAEEDDHSSVGRVSSRSRSLLSVGTIESEPVGVIGTGGGTGGGGGGGASSRWNPRSTSSIMTPSTASLESQLATQLARHATVASASDSSLSLGRRVHAPSTSQLHPAPVYDHRSVRVPGRSANLPSILGDWPPGPPDEIKDQINPIFRVVSKIERLQLGCKGQY